MLDAMRRNTKIILWITVISFVLLIFLVWGADLQTGGKARANSAGAVNGQQITWQAYQQMLNFRRENARSQGRDLRPSDELLIEQQTWDSMVESMLLRQEAERRGLEPKDSEIRAVLLNNPPAAIRQSFVNDQGQFDMNAYRNFLADPGTPEQTLIYLETLVRQDLPAQKLQQLITSGTKVTEDEARRTWVEQTEKATVSYVLIPTSGADIQQDVSDADLNAYYNEHKDEYTLPRRATLRYVAVPRVATAIDSVQIQAELQEFADEARRAMSGEERASDLATLALTFSDAPDADQGGLSAGYLVADEMTTPTRDAIQGLAEGEISKPFQDGGYYKVVQVVDILEPGETPPAPETSEATGEAEEDQEETPSEPVAERSYQLRDLSLRIAPSDSTIQATQDALDSLRVDALAMGLAKAAALHGYPVETAANVTASGIVPGLSAIPQVSAFAHDNPVGTVSRVLATNNAWYVLEVAGVTPEGVPPLADIADRVKQDVLAERRYEATRAAADRVLAHVESGDSLAAAAQAESLQVTTTPEFTRRLGIPGLGRDPDLLGAAFTLPVGQVSKPIKANRGWVILKVDARPELDWAKFDEQKPQVIQSLLQTKQLTIYNAWIEALRKKAVVQDNRT